MAFSKTKCSSLTSRRRRRVPHHALRGTRAPTSPYCPHRPPPALPPQVARAVLRRCGIPTVDLANHGLEAVEAVEKKFYPLIFMDVRAP